MKKLLTLFVMAVVFMLLPYSIKAVVELDENGNPITSDIPDGQMRILTENNDTSSDEKQQFLEEVEKLLADISQSVGKVDDNSNDGKKEETTTGNENTEKN